MDLLLRALLLTAGLSLGCQREAAAPGTEHWQASRAAREQNDVRTSLAQAETGALVRSLGREATNELILARAASAADGALPSSLAERQTLGFQVGLLLDQSTLSAADRATLFTARARLAMETNDRATARVALDTARREAPTHSLSARVLAALDLAENKDVEALALFEKVATAGDLSLETARGYATAMIRLGQSERAAQFLVGAVTMHSDSSLGLLLADAAEQAGKPQLAVGTLEQLVIRAPTPLLHRRLGEAYLDQRRLDEAERELRAALTEGPDVEASLSLAHVELERGNAERARAGIEHVYAQLPAKPRALFTACVVLAKTGDEQSAKALAAQFGVLAQRDVTQSRRAELLAALFKSERP